MGRQKRDAGGNMWTQNRTSDRRSKESRFMSDRSKSAR